MPPVLDCSCFSCRFVGITNTLITNYATAISRTNGSVYENYNLFYGTTISKTGTFVAGSGANDITGNPNFINPAFNDYHLGAGSVAIDVGIDVGVTNDFEGNTRPQGEGFDIGYDEKVVSGPVYLPLVLKN